MKSLLLALSLLALTACGGRSFQPVGNGFVPPNGPSVVDDSIVRGVAVITVTTDQTLAIFKYLNDLLMSTAFAASTATTTVTYNNAPAVTFTINTAALTAGAFTGDTLSLGAVTVSSLKDNNLKLCAPGGNTKCTTAILRVYTTGSVAGFVNTSDSPQYGAPVFASGLNPTTALPLLSPGVAVQQVTGMANSKHTVLLTDFPSPTYNVTSDFSNAGSGSYSMVFVVEYALAP